MKIPKKILISIAYNNECFNVEVPTELTVHEAKNKVVSSLNELNKEKGNNAKIPEAINFYHNGKILEDDKLLVNYGIWDGAVIAMR